MRIPILSYQPMSIHGNEYHDNHLKALASDLRQLTGAGFKIVAIRSVIDAWLDNRGAELDAKWVALSCDDGADFDYLDLPHPTAGVQRSVFNVLRDFAAQNKGLQDELNVTSFVIASPEARAALDSACMIGKGWWTDGWWPDATRSGLVHIGSHSWDYNHEALPPAISQSVRRGTFLTINSLGLADHEIRQASEFLRRHAPNPGTGLFAYPYGEANHYLTHEYFPRYGAELGIRAAFTARADFLEPGCSRWEVPRFFFGRDWTTPAELDAILEAAADSGRAWVPVKRQQQRTPPRQGAGSRSAAANREFTDFLASSVDPIPGWMNSESALLTAHMAKAQREQGLSGPTLEIGIYKGKYLSVLYELSEPGEIVVGVDLFVGAEDKQAAADVVRANIATACGGRDRLKIVVADSLELTSERLAEAAGVSRFRFISIDGGHTKELVIRDLETAYPLLQSGGIIALDDAFNLGTPGVIEGITEFFFRREPRLAPFANCYNKLFVTTPDFHARYLSEAWAFLENVSWLPTHERTLASREENLAAGFTPMMFGYEVVAFL